MFFLKALVADSLYEDHNKEAPAQDILVHVGGLAIIIRLLLCGHVTLFPGLPPRLHLGIRGEKSDLSRSLGEKLTFLQGCEIQSGREAWERGVVVMLLSSRDA